jgi:hypothetical protein
MPNIERVDNMDLAGQLRVVQDMVDKLRDIATASLIDNRIDETARLWMIY